MRWIKKHVKAKGESRAGAMMTAEFALALIGVVVIALLVSRTSSWFVNWIGALGSTHNESRIDAGSASPGVTAGLGGAEINLVDGAGQAANTIETLGGFSATAGRAELFVEDCGGYLGAMTSAIQLRRDAYNAVFGDADSILFYRDRIGGALEGITWPAMTAGEMPDPTGFGAYIHYDWANEAKEHQEAIEAMNPEDLFQNYNDALAACAPYDGCSDSHQCDQDDPCGPGECGEEQWQCRDPNYCPGGYQCGPAPGCSTIVGCDGYSCCSGPGQEWQDCVDECNSAKDNMDAAEQALHDIIDYINMVIDIWVGYGFDGFPPKMEQPYDYSAVEAWANAVVQRLNQIELDEADLGAYLVSVALSYFNAGNSQLLDKATDATEFSHDAEELEFNALIDCLP